MSVQLQCIVWYCKLGHFLRILFGCHARPDRSFYFRGHQFPICARCTGELIGILAGIPIAVIWGYPKFYIVVLMIAPLVIDGTVQRFTPYESTNIRRLITGTLFGIALIFLLIYFHRACFIIAAEILKLFWDDPQRIERALEIFI